LQNEIQGFLHGNPLLVGMDGLVADRCHCHDGEGRHGGVVAPIGDGTVLLPLLADQELNGFLDLLIQVGIGLEGISCFFLR